MPTYDCSYPVETGMPVYPDDPAVRVERHAEMGADGYRVSALRLGSHAGTHVDAPSHTEPDGKTLGAFPVEAFRFDAQLAPLAGHGDRDPVRVADLPDPTDADLLVLRTGWDAHWATDRYLDHPYLTPEAAAWCVDHDYHVAIDAPSVDPTPTANAAEDEPGGFPAHHLLLGSDRLIVENLTNLDSLPDRFTLHAYPLALDADGAPVRAVATTD